MVLNDGGAAAAKKEETKLDVPVGCPDCGALSEISFSRKHATIQLTCPDCGIVEEETVRYGAGATVGDIND
jgi:predicted RNA-binding Zn-ribbon protein involved in translation (DUF1610 family)